MLIRLKLLLVYNQKDKFTYRKGCHWQPLLFTEHSFSNFIISYRFKQNILTVLLIAKSFNNTNFKLNKISKT
jgi:hypothetical protein